MLIYLITGYATSGKDTVGSIFERVGFRRYAFADPLKAYSANFHGYNPQLALTQSGKETIIQSTKTNRSANVRQFLIEDSLKMKKEYGENVWADAIVEKIKTEAPKYVVITDWRYRHEFQHIKANLPEAKLITIRVIRDTVRPLQDPSEHDLDSVSANFTIRNNASMDALTNHCYDILAKEI